MFGRVLVSGIPSPFDRAATGSVPLHRGFVSPARRDGNLSIGSVGVEVPQIEDLNFYLKKKI